MNNLNNANFIKALFIDFLLEAEHNNYIIGSEVMFAYKKVVADLILLSNNSIQAFEIKAKNDDLRKLESQLIEYNKVFDFVNVLVTENHFLKANQIVSPKNGLIIVKNNLEIEIYRHPVQNIILNKEELLSTMSANFIKKYFKINTQNLSSSKIRNPLLEKDIEEIRNALYLFLKTRISNKYLNFIYEKGIKTHFEDITLLSMPNKKISL